MTAAIKLSPGDSMARLALPDPAGELFHFADQAHSGYPVVLWIVEADPSDVAEELAKWAPEFSGLGALVFGVIPGRRGDELPLPAGRTELILLDPQRNLARVFAPAGSGLIVLDADLRVAAVSADGDLGGALEVCRHIFERSAPSVLRAQAPVHLVHHVLEAELCRKLIGYWEAGEKKADMVALSSPDKSQALPDMKKRDDVIVSEPALLEAVRARIVGRLVPEVRKVFNYAMSHFESVRIGCYDSGRRGYFRRHRDNMTPQTSRRRFAVSLNLNAGEYEGGQVRFPEYSRALYAPETGAALVFSCSLVHEAMPVTAGRRFGAFTFAFDAAGEAGQRH